MEVVLRRSQQAGFIGGGPIGDHIDHALGFAMAAGEVPARAADLGSGGGLPGLVLAALTWEPTEWFLIDASARRCRFLVDAVSGLGLGDRISVLHRRAEDAGRDHALRHAFEVVVARSFGPPAATAECGAPLLSDGGRLAVSDPPAGPAERWPAPSLAELGLVRRGASPTGRGHYTVLDAVGPCPDRFPRRAPLPATRPLF